MEWAYMAALSFLMGFACLAPFRKKGGCQIHSAVTYMMAGLLVLNVYAEYFSLFAGVGFWASLIAVFAAVIGGMLLRRDLADFFKISKIQACQKKKERSDEGIENSKSLWRKKNKAVWLLYAGLTLLFAYGSSRGYMHYDTGLYHAQAIRWIEEYGVVPGLANLHSRFGYNSASFALSAFFSETWLIGRPMHCVAGFFALLCACKCAAGLMAFWKRKKVRISDFLSIGGIFYLIAVFREMVSPASDYFAMLVLFWVIMTWVELWEQERDCPIGEKQTVPYALLSLYLVYAATVKLSTAVILLLVLYPAVLLLRQKKWLQIAGYIALGLLIAFPYLARNVLISGWLIYPFAAIDLFSVDWKIPASYLQNDSDQIKVWGRCLYDVTKINDPVSAWFPVWWGEKDRYEMMLLIANMVAGISAVLSVVWKRIRKEKLCWDRVVVYAAVLGGIAGWFFLAPFIRYGLAFLLIFPLMAFGEWLRPMRMGPVRIASGFLCAAIFFSLSMYWDYYVLFDLVWGKQHLTDPAWVVQQDYDSVEVESFEMEGGLIVYYPAGGQENISYDAFPATAYRMMAERTKLRGSDIRDGFMPK